MSRSLRGNPGRSVVRFAPLALIVVVPLIPVTGDPPVAGASQARIGVIIFLLLLGLAMVSLSGHLVSDRWTRLVVTPLIALSGAGLLAALGNSEGLSDFLHSASLLAGQPLAYAGIFALYAAAIDYGPSMRERLLQAWALAMSLEGLVVVWQFLSGHAYNPLYGFARAQGTTGANFLGTFAAMSLFGALALRSVASTKRVRMLADSALAASILSLALSTSRGPIVGAALGVAFLFMQYLRSGGRVGQRRAAAAITIVALLGAGVFLSRGLWESRLNSRTANFDRLATWSSGIRMAEDHPIAGVGPTHIVTLIEDNPRYRDTPYGQTSSVPHNFAIYALAAGGVACGLFILWFAINLIRALLAQWRPRSHLPDSPYLAAALIAAIPGFLINNVFTHSEIMVVFLLAAALVIRPGSPDEPV